MKIRQATQEDAGAIARLWEALVAYHRNLDHDLPAAAPNGGILYARRLTDRLYDTHTRVLVAEVDHQVVGYILGVIVDLSPEMFAQENSGFLADIYVDEDYRGQGVGRALVTDLTAWFVERGVSHFEWYVASRNQAGRSFWNAIGGHETMIRMRQNLKTEH